MSEKLKKITKEVQEKARPKIDCKAELIDPIDFSFKDLMSLEEINDAIPRYADRREPKKHSDGKYESLGLKLGYNALKDINGLYDWCVFSFAFPEKISTLDISFNCLSNIPNEVLRFVGLKCLYLHANKISDLKEVDKLKSLKNIDVLTLHGNPIENLPIFKHYILSKLPKLRSLNFTGLSKADRQTAVIRIKTNTTPLVVENRKSEENSKKATKKDDD